MVKIFQKNSSISLVSVCVCILFLSVVLLSGCGSSGRSTPAISRDEALRQIARSLNAWGDSLWSLFYIRQSHFRNATLKAVIPEDNGWFYVVDQYSYEGFNYSVNLHFQFLDSSGNVITDLENDSDRVVTVKIYGTESLTGSGISYNYTYGSGISAPFVISNAQQDQVLINGLLSISYNESGHTYLLSYNFNNLQINTGVDASNYPNGSATVTLNYDGQNVYNANIVFNGTNIARVTFSDNGSYLVNLDNGEITPALDL